MWKAVIIAASIALVGCASPSSAPSGAASSPAAPDGAVASVIATASNVITPLCADAQAAKTVAVSTLKGGALNTVQPYANLVDASCGSAEAITTLAADPTSANWIQGITSTLKTAAAVATIVSAQSTAP